MPRGREAKWGRSEETSRKASTRLPPVTAQWENSPRVLALRISQGRPDLQVQGRNLLIYTAFSPIQEQSVPMEPFSSRNDIKQRSNDRSFLMENFGVFLDT